MLYEFALTVGCFEKFPQAVGPVTDQALVQILYGLRQNGILANLYNGSWWAEVQRRGNAIPGRVRAVVLDLLKQLFDRGRIVERQKEGQCCPTCDVEWLDEAIASHNRVAFQGIIARRDSINARNGLPPCAIALEEALLAPQWNNRTMSRRVTRTSAEFESALAPVLGTARFIMLIDPQLGLRVANGNLEFLRMLSVVDNCAVPDNRRCSLRVVEIHTRDDSRIPNDRYIGVIQAVARAMPKTVATAKRRVFRAWQAKPNGPPLHNRRIVTNQTAVSCPWGLDIHERPGHTPGDDEWALLNDDVRTAIWTDFQPNSSPYDLRHDIPW